ncbi:MAG: AraC family transcriptional regulator [Oscillospiraceae bacterium]|nr:AraC family transcriptional regulator [Oscillospiraceae bacterium]
MGSRPVWLINKYLRDVNPREAGEEICSGADKAGPFYRSHYLLHYVLSGTGTFRINGQDYPAAKGQLAILYPGEVMSHRTGADDPWHYVWAGFETTLDVPVLGSRVLIDLPQADHIFRALKDADKIPCGKELYVCGKIYELLALLHQFGTNAVNETVDFITQVKYYIDSNFHLPITVEQLARDMHVSRGYFSTAFRRYIGMSPQAYLTDVRMKHAAELLATERCPVNIAAIRSGYADIYNFSRMFKKHFGVSPKMYAQMHDYSNST